ncbi:MULTISPECIES: hypothetical protein [Cupriavidus]|nr:hypothetical protein [Cupriavidus metallidurans]
MEPSFSFPPHGATFLKANKKSTPRHSPKRPEFWPVAKAHQATLNKTGTHMPQTATLNSLANRTPFDQLIGGLYSTIWITKTIDGYAISGRSKADDAVVSLAGDGAPALLNDLDSVLAGEPCVDVQVGRAAYGITKMAIVGGTEYAMTEHARIPPTGRGEPTVVI